MHIHINRPSSTRFQAAVRLGGHRNWIMVGKPTKSAATAILRMARKFSSWSMYKRGAVIMTADYYDPTITVEMKR